MARCTRKHAMSLCWALATLAVLTSVAAADTQLSSGDAEAAILRQLRQAVLSWDPEWCRGWKGWQPDSPLEPCSWDKVTCTAGGHVTALRLFPTDHPFFGLAGEEIAPATAGGRPSGNQRGPGPLLPALSRLPQLQLLYLGHPFMALSTGLPREWGQPGAFLRLNRLGLSAPGLKGTLPEVQPGALPLLEELVLLAPSMATTLPASWGTNSSTFPQLRKLHLQLAITGALPAAWAQGFPSLAELTLDQPAPADPGQKQLSGGLPAAWASGFPRLSHLYLWRLPLHGATVPAEWVPGFPSLTSLHLIQLGLRGTLPSQLLARHERLKALQLSDNAFTGTLPAEWAKAQHLETLLLFGNALTGPAFPPAWLEAGSMPLLLWLDLSGNRGLNGTLPAELAWPNLAFLELTNTSTAGRVPEAWCQAPFNATIRLINTGASRVLPSCATRSMPGMRPGGHSLPGQPPDSAGSARTARPTAAAAPLASYAALAAALAGAVAAFVWRRRRQRARPPQQVLLGLEGKHLLGLDSSAKESRLGTLLRSHAGDRLRMLPVHLLQQAFAHSVASPSNSAGGSAGGASPPASAVPPGSLEAWGERPSEPSGSDSSGRTASAGVQQPTAAALGWPAAGSQEVATRRWGLDTDGLRVGIDEVVVVADVNGDLVQLGAGSHAEVFLGRMGGSLVALKVLEVPAGMSSAHVWREAAVLKRCMHARVVPLFGIALKGPLLILATGLMPRGSLWAGLQKAETRAQLQWNVRGWQVAVDVAEALAYLHHTLGVRHGDLKTSNVLLDYDWRACLADLGMAQFMGKESLVAAGFSASHAAPEQLLGQRCTLAVDVYALGVVLTEIATGATVTRKRRGQLQQPQDCPQALSDLIRQCTAVDPAARPSAQQVLHVLRGLGPEPSGAPALP